MIDATVVSAAPPVLRPVDLVVISDVHLGTRDCKAEALHRYLDTLAPAEVVLNGDILDLREMKTGFWPESHADLLRRLMRFAEEGIPVHYVTGNHDALLRRLSPFVSGSFRLCDHLERTLDGQATLIMHGDGIEWAMPMSKSLRKVGCIAYHLARRLDRWTLALGMPINLVRNLKSTNRATAHIAAYEEACARDARARGFDTVVTGHIHAACMREISLTDGPIQYCNSGDWVDSQTALEYHGGTGWRLMHVDADGDVRPVGHARDTSESESLADEGSVTQAWA